MILKRFYEDRLAQASYLVGCSAAGEAIVVDPNRDIQQYLDAAADEGLKITAVTETHIHADFVSGAHALAQAAGARLFVSGLGGPDWQYTFADEPNVTLLQDGSIMRVGNIKLEAVHTPGHTPEHMSYIVTDEASSDIPLGAFTGDFLFVGDVGRPDLLEKAAGITGTMVDAAKTLYHSLNRFAQYPDHLMIWPAHGAGSACGKSLGGVPSSSLGYERIANWAFHTKNEGDFVNKVLDGQPEPPRYFAEMKRVNKFGVPVWKNGQPKALAPDDRKLLDAAGAVLIDLRPASEFAAAFVPGSLPNPLSRNFTTWIGSLVNFDQTIYFLAPSPKHAYEAAHALSMIGMDNVQGAFDSSLIKSLEANHAGYIEPGDLLTSGRQIVDVRKATEFREAHIPGAHHLPLGYLEKEIGDHKALIAKDTPIVVHCLGGPRAALGASLLKRMGYTDVVELKGGFIAYQRLAADPGKAPVESGMEPAQAGAGSLN